MSILEGNQPDEICKTKQLIVEGTDDKVFFEHLLGHLNLSDTFQVQAFGGVPKLKPWLKGFVRSPDFSDVEALGIVRDADNSSMAAFDSVCGAITNAALMPPREPFLLQDGEPRINVCILPGPSAQSGMLENLCLSMVEGDPAMTCITAYLDCLQQLSLPLRNPAKAKLQAFLASREKPVIGLVGATYKGYWNWEHPAIIPIIDFLRSL
ncbi:hypothetical protein IQ260_12925 [Leptolyngbya cf. ectocarpi LEGE 11479]|uniref:Uncharacterized protein n=1 Tax=Leptolyngbya cf. ectocarpi LEGE 11479 TaxID=1828722 RepID=A0A928ZUA0_LEPEC|nr:DUF3226 domain-containing protein [Leptolyngbya ectocarpi]MBE9067563.1 hypothetical protein [Leptolyngbya cf. ectocarpi LEGE 11479]